MKRIIAVVLVAMLLASVVPAAAFAATYKAYHTTASYLNIRSGPSTSSPKVGSALPRGTGVFALSSYGNWKKVRVFSTGKVGWVSNTYLSSKARARVDTPHGGNLNVRRSPGGTTIGSIKDGTKVTVYKINGYSGPWVYLYGGGLTGWSYYEYPGKYLTFIKY